MAKKVFNTPMQYSRTPPGGRPSPSRSDVLREELGLGEEEEEEEGAGRTESESGSESESEMDSSYGRVVGLEMLLLQKEVANRNKEREGLVDKLNKLRVSYHDSTMKLQKSENVRRQHLSMIKKTYEAQLDEKRAIIANLEDIVTQQETKIIELESTSQESMKSETISQVHSEPSQSEPSQSESGTSEAETREEMEQRYREMEQHYRHLEQHCQEISDTLEKQKHAHTSREEEYRTTLDRYNKDLNAYKQKIKNYENKLSGYSDLESRWEDLVRENEEMSQRLNSAQTQGREAELEERVQNLQAENNHLATQLKTLHDHNNHMERDFEQEMEEARSENERMGTRFESEMAEARDENERMGTRMARMQQKIQELESREPEVVTQYEKVEVESEELRAALEAAESSNNELTGHITSLRMTCRQHEEASQQMEDEIDDLEQKVAQQSRELQDMETSYQEQLEELKHRTQRKLQQSFKAYARIQQVVVKLHQQVETLSREYKAVKDLCEKFPGVMKETIHYVREEMGAALASMSEKEDKLLQSLRKEIYNRNKYRDQVVALKGNIRVFARVRPLIPEDGTGPSSARVVDSDPMDDTALSVRFKNRPQQFSFDRVFMMGSTQDEIFHEAEAMITCCLDGYNVCIFAYGQTSAGKTFTMEGTTKNPGLNRRALMRMFEIMDEREAAWEYQITVSYLEIYNETLRDLLVSEKQQQRLEMKMRSDGQIHVPGLTITHVQDYQDVQELFRLGLTHRATASTALNKQSSRSHALLVVNVHGTDRVNNTTLTGKLNLVDLAGSERVNKSGVDGARLREAQCINKSLSTLGDVIHALKNNQPHVPYRNSKLTYLLHDSLGGDSKTLMIAQCTPNERNVNETLCTLTFGQRCRQVELGPAKRKVNESKEKKVDPSASRAADPSAAAASPRASAVPVRSRSYPSALI